MKFDRKQFLKDRKEAFTDAVMKDDWTKFKKYCKKYGVPKAENEIIMKVGCYKAVQECTDLPDEVKFKAAAKCVEMGFRPTMW